MLKHGVRIGDRSFLEHFCRTFRFSKFSSSARAMTIFNFMYLFCKAPLTFNFCKCLCINSSKLSSSVQFLNKTCYTHVTYNNIYFYILDACFFIFLFVFTFLVKNKTRLYEYNTLEALDSSGRCNGVGSISKHLRVSKDFKYLITLLVSSHHLFILSKDLS